MTRTRLRKAPWGAEPWQKTLVGAGVVLALFLAAVNGAIAFFGNTDVFPLSPFHLEAKLHALQRYALHRPKCLLTGHPLTPELARHAERRYGLPPGLLQAVFVVESRGEPHRISPTGAMGVAQLMPGTARELGVKDPFDSETAVDGGGRYLASLLAQFHDVRLAVAAYNAGPGAIVGRAIPHNGETEYYVPRVMAEYARLAPVQLRGELHGAPRGAAKVRTAAPPAGTRMRRKSSP